MITIQGTKKCNCTGCEESTGDDSHGEGDDEGLVIEIFYVVIGCVGGLIFVVVLVTVIYHCIMLGTWVNRRRDVEEE